MKYLFVLLIWMALAGCAHDQANRYYGSQKYLPVSVDEVELLRSKPNRPFEVIADFQSRNESPKSIKRKAADIGAHAVIVTKLGGDYLTTDQWADQDTMRQTYTRIVGTAIRYTDQ